MSRREDEGQPRDRLTLHEAKGCAGRQRNPSELERFSGQRAVRLIPNARCSVVGPDVGRCLFGTDQRPALQSESGRRPVLVKPDLGPARTTPASIKVEPDQSKIVHGNRLSAASRQSPTVVALNGLRSGASACGTAPSRPRKIQFNGATRWRTHTAIGSGLAPSPAFGSSAVLPSESRVQRHAIASATVA